MRHGKFETPRRQFSPTVWIVLLLAVTAMSLGGVGAYLLHSAAQPVTNEFITEAYPQVSVDGDYKVTIAEPDYAVYLRAAVVVNWKSNSGNNILITMPVEKTDYVVNSAWLKKEDGFYYYNQPVSKALKDNLIEVNAENNTIKIKDPIVTLSGTKAGYTLVADVAVQAIQAVGKTDDGSQTAVQDAWGLTP